MLKTSALAFIFVLIFQISAVAAAEKNSNQIRPVIGTVENVILDDTDIVMKARIDTGAGLSSINAEVVEIKKSKDLKSERVVFRVDDKKGHKETMERKIVEWINIKKKGDAGYIKRPVIKLEICLGGKRVESRVNLADRSSFLYPLLIGRNFLKVGDYMIDPQKTFIQSAGCP